MHFFDFIIWDFDPTAFTLPFLNNPVRYYGILFMLGFVISQRLLFYIFKKEDKPQKDVETLTIYMLIATVVGARLGHILFYEPERYFNNPIEILYLTEGGLASHGAAIGIFLGLWLYTKFHVKRLNRINQSYLQTLDRIAIAVALVGCLIRMGNFANSEIYGKPTHSSYGVVFTNHLKDAFLTDASPIKTIDFEKDDHKPTSTPGYEPIIINLSFKPHPDVKTKEGVSLYLETTFQPNLEKWDYLKAQFHQRGELNYEVEEPTAGVFIAHVHTYGITRHPTQLYESFTCLLLFILLMVLWNKRKKDLPSGLLFGIFLTWIFGLRFVHEFFKENQVAFEDGMTLNMGQILSIPLIIAGIIILVRAVFNQRKKA